MFGFNTTRSTTFGQIKPGLLDESAPARKDREEKAYSAGVMKMMSGLATAVSSAVTGVSLLRTMGGSRFIGPLLSLAGAAVATASHETMRISGNLEELLDQQPARVTAARSSEFFVAQMTKKTVLVGPLGYTTMVRFLNREIPQQRNG